MFELIHKMHVGPTYLFRPAIVCHAYGDMFAAFFETTEGRCKGKEIR